MDDETPLHEDWAAVKGLPSYAWLLRWPSATAIALYKLAITGRKVEDRRQYLVTRMNKRVFASKDYQSWCSRDLDLKFRKGKTSEFFLPEDLLFSQDDFDLCIERGREYHRERTLREIKQVRIKMEDLAKTLAGMDDCLVALHEPVPSRAWATLPETSPNRKRRRERPLVTTIGGRRLIHG